MERETNYEGWIRQQGIPIADGYGIQDVREIPRRPWRVQAVKARLSNSRGWRDSLECT